MDQDPISATQTSATDTPTRPAGQAAESAPRTPSGPPRKARAASWVNIALGVAVVVAIGGVSFAAGRLTAPAGPTRDGFPGNGQGQFPGGSFNPNGGFGGGGGGLGGGRGGFGGGSLEGTVESVSPTTLTLKLASGQTIQVALDSTTTYHSQASASSDAVVSGGTVIVQVNLGGQAGGAAAGPSARDITIVP